MNEKAELLVDILEEKNKKMRVRSSLQDGTSFELWVDVYDVRRLPPVQDPTKHQYRGYMTVEYTGESNRIASIVLPKPHLELGKRVSVSTSLIQRV